MKVEITGKLGNGFILGVKVFKQGYHYEETILLTVCTK